jgi:YVTN family beta-propeller protein
VKPWRAVLVAAVAAACAPAPTPPATVVRARPPAPKPTPTLGAVAVFHLPTGADLTPRAAPGSTVLELDPKLEGHAEFRAGYAVSLALSPDGKTLALLTSGYNQMEDAQGQPLPGTRSEYVFFYDVSLGAPVEKQVVTLPNAFVGLAFAPTGDALYASGGPDDDLVVLARADTGWTIEGTVPLGHTNGLGVSQGPLAAGIAVTPDGARVLVADHENDALTVVDARTHAVREIPLRPGRGVAGGEFPFGVAVAGGRAYVTAQRDREIDEVDLDAGRVTRRLPVGGQPVRIVATRDAKKLYVADANTDDVTIVDRARLVVERRVPVGGPPGSLAASLRGASPNGLSLSPDEKTLYVSLGGANAVAVVSVAGSARLVGLVPTGFYPNDVVAARDGKTIYCAYGKSVTGPNPKGPWFEDVHVHHKPFGSLGGNQFSLQLHHGGLHAFPTPDATTLGLLTTRALDNEHLASPPAAPPIFAALRGKVRRVVYVISENRTFDQILGDLPGLDGDPRLVHWGQTITPNQHALAMHFCGFDRFFDSGGVSGDGWQWSTAGRATDVAEKEIPLMYAARGSHTYDWEGKNRGVNVSLASSAERHAQNPRSPDDPDLLPGTADVAAVDRPREGGTGYLWDAAKHAGLRVRNYGFFIDDARYHVPRRDPSYIAPVREPSKTKTRVAYPTALGLADDTDPYYRGFDTTFPDFWRVLEWRRELQAYDAAGDMPELVLVRLPHDHLGAFDRALDGVDTPDTQIADHDYALGLLVEALSRSRFWNDTIVFALEDDAQDGADHVDSHRSVLFVAGGYAAREAVSHTTYTTPSVLRTIELLLGLPPLGRRDAVAPPIAEALSETLDDAPLTAIVPDVLRSTKLPLPKPARGEHAVSPRGTARAWASVTRGMRFDREDEAPAAAFNAALYCGLVSPTHCAR